jgi:hypothetical protein
MPSDNGIQGSEKRAAIGSWLGVPLLIRGSSHTIPNPFLFFLGIPIVLLGAKAILDTSRLARFGDPVFEPGAGPFHPGGTLDGRLNLNPKAAAIGQFKLTLACIHRTVTNSGKNSHVSEKILWKNDVTTAVLPGGILPVAMEIPVDQPSTNRTNPNDGILWRLTVRAASGHFTFLEKYEIVIGAPSL